MSNLMLKFVICLTFVWHLFDIWKNCKQMSNKCQTNVIQMTKLRLKSVIYLTFVWHLYDIYKNDKQMSSKCQTNVKQILKVSLKFVIFQHLSNICLTFVQKRQANVKQMSNKCHTNIKFEAQICQLCSICLTFVWHL